MMISVEKIEGAIYIVKAPLYWWYEYDLFHVGSVIEYIRDPHVFPLDDDIRLDEFDIKIENNSTDLGHNIWVIMKHLNALARDSENLGDRTRYLESLRKLTPQCYICERKIYYGCLFELAISCISKYTDHADIWAEFIEKVVSND